MCMTQVVLHQKVHFNGENPTLEELDLSHEQALTMSVSLASLIIKDLKLQPIMV